MLEAHGNLWTFPANYRCITTNGTIKQNGACVMGRGCAREARDKYPGLDRELGAKILERGNRLHLFPAYCLITFPVKHHWQEKADLDLIQASGYALRELAETLPGKTFVLPRPGCGNGGRTWEEVRLFLLMLPDTVTVITW